ncbi:MAG: OmpH family outer membrane protein [Bacteroidales bacterium]|nr:OmpH family outer membrane protein [Bacteroidales bacterium]
MKKITLIIAVVAFSAMAGYAQKFAYVDTEYILSNIPSYKAAQTELEKQSTEWQQEVEGLFQEIDKMYREYQAEKVLLTQEMRSKREEEIINKERAAKQLQNDYFGQEGLLFKKREEKIKPIQDEIYNALKEISNESGYAIVFDTSGGPVILFTNPRYDISDEVLIRLGYKN